MREWGSGTQTDFTNYAVQRLAERGLLREEDTIKMQRAVAEIAYSYARGGNAASGYVPTDSPLGPTQPLPEAIGWSAPLRGQYESQVRGSDGNAITDQACDRETFMPTVLPAGLAPSADPVLSARAPSYGVSLGRRLSN